MFQIEFTTKARKDVGKLSARMKDRCVGAMRKLRENPLLGEPLFGEHQGYRRYRVGDFRIIYEIGKKQKLLTVHAVKHRREAYR